MEDDKKQLTEFLNTLQTDLQFVIDIFDSITPKQHNEKELLERLWNKDEIKKVFEDVRNQIYEKNIVDLASVALSGDQLAVKINVYVKFRAKLRQTAEKTKNLLEIGTITKKIIKLIWMLFKAADTILGSLSKVVSGADVVGEIKDTIENIINLANMED